MDTRQIISKAYLVWFVLASFVVILALGSMMEGQAWWKIAIVLVAYVSLVRGAGCFFCKRSREVLQSELPEQADTAARTRTA